MKRQRLSIRDIAKTAIALTCVTWLGTASALRAQPGAKRTPEERQQLEAKAKSLHDKGSKLLRQASFVEAAELLEQALTLRKRLYPKEQFPNGHRSLALNLNDLGVLYFYQGKYDRALPYYQQALAMQKLLYPKQRFPTGHEDLIASLLNVGNVLKNQGELTKALTYHEQAIQMARALYPMEKYPKGHRVLAAALQGMGTLFFYKGEYAKATIYGEQVLNVYQKLYPKEQHPDGHRLLVDALSNLGMMLDAKGEHARALPYLEKAFGMARKLYPKERFPRGHPVLASQLGNLADVLYNQRKHQKALSIAKAALAMKKELYPPTRYPNGHPSLAHSLNNVAKILQRQGEFAEALAYLEKSLEMLQRLCPKERFPDGHPRVAICLQNVGNLLLQQGEHTKALPYYQKSLRAHERLYPKKQFPTGHPDLGKCLQEMGYLHLEQAAPAKALPLFQRAMEINRAAVLRVAGSASEAELRNFLVSLPFARSGYLAASAELTIKDDLVYQHVWQSKAIYTRILEQRHLTLLAASHSKEIYYRWQELLDKRRQLSKLMLSRPRDQGAHQKRLRLALKDKEKLERELAQRLPALSERHVDQPQPADLIRVLPKGTVFIDLLSYSRLADRDPKKPRSKRSSSVDHYVAFVLSSGRPVKRTELGAAQQIEKAIQNWLRAIVKRKPSTASEVVRRLIWDKIAKHLPADTKTIHLACPRLLAQLPWPALPGEKDGSVLLEQHAFTLVPHGPFLHERLRGEPQKAKGAGRFLIVGGVDYDRAPEALASRPTTPGVIRSAALSSTKVIWPSLPGTLKELKQIVAVAREQATASQIVVRQGRQASTTQILADLGNAKKPIRWAHLGTHGFFADPSFRSFFDLDQRLFVRDFAGHSIGIGARNPLTLSGLVLAGANCDSTSKKELEEDNGILTGEGLVSLDLRQLELAVLSACDSGRGVFVGNGEGTFGLQRAFHLAGAKNVVASLWKVSDEGTAALMVLFYHKLWQEKKDPLHALREAQLTLYRHPERIPILAKERGLRLKRVISLPNSADPKQKPQRGSPTKVWASFVLSGIGR